MENICVLGSINMDLVVKVNRMVNVGETILSEDFYKNSGGKGANQSVAASRLGAKVHMIGKTGNDDNGDILLKKLVKDNVDIEFIGTDDINPTGMAIIMVDKEANNSIVVIPGANMNIDCSDVQKARDVIIKSRLIIAQFETPVEATIEAFKIARENNVTTILNPAPARGIPDELLALTDIIIPNETEAYELTKIKVENEDSIREAAGKFLEHGVKYVIITLGERGAALVSKQDFEVVKALKVKALDTTAAGDSFIGALASRLCSFEKIGFEKIREAVVFANKVSSMVVQKAGAQESLPSLNEVVEEFGEV
ncbi:MAG: ribokinase [Firmicutes bacterium]|nr:ribokinase [Bacillota bacterium]